MKTTYEAKKALDPDLFVRAVPVWQAQRKMKEGRRYPDNIIYMPPKKEREHSFEKDKPHSFLEENMKPILIFMAIALALTLCAALS